MGRLESIYPMFTFNAHFIMRPHTALSAFFPTLWILIFSLLFFWSCRPETGQELEPEAMLATVPQLILNPNGNAPLSAELRFRTKTPCTVEWKLTGPDPVSHHNHEAQTDFALPILGLYPDQLNDLHFTIRDELGNYAHLEERVQTAPLPDYLPEIQIEQINESQMEEGWNFSELHLANFGNFRSMPILFDSFGTIRWYVDLTDQPTFCIPIFRLQNGNLCFSTGRAIKELDWLGRIVSEWDLGEFYDPHHEVIELPNGNFIVAVSKTGATILLDGAEVETEEDFLIEIVRETGAVKTEWDLREVLDVSRTALIDGQGDWIHVNGVWYHQPDHSLVISARNQGLFKINWDNELIWILAPHLGWGKAGRDGQGEETAPYLLTAVGADGTPYPNAIQFGGSQRPDFDWTWGQHTPMYLPNGNLFVFDNGFNRNFGNSLPYSRGVEYAIDEDAMTVQQVWQYGKDRGDSYYSGIISDVDYLSQTGNRLIMPGNIRGASVAPQANITEVSYPDGQLIFEARLLFQDQNSDGIPGFGQMDIVYRSERMALFGRD